MRFVSGLALFLIFSFIGSLISACGPKYPKCENDEDCRENEYCVNNQCQQCRDDGDCPAGQECVAGACREIGYCETSDDCAEGQVCRDNYCRACLNNGECPSNMVCLDGVCIEPECTTDDDCPAGLACINYKCTSDESEASHSGMGDCGIESIYFAFDSSLLGQKARRKIKDNYDCLKSNNGRVLLEGHADPRGTTEYNMALGDRRARSVKKYMGNLGIERERLRVVSKGEEESMGYNESTWAEDRRVDFE